MTDLFDGVELPQPSDGQRAIWAGHQQWIRAWAESVAESFEAQPDKTWSGTGIGRLLRDMLDQSDVTFDHFVIPRSDTDDE